MEPIGSTTEPPLDRTPYTLSAHLWHSLSSENVSGDDPLPPVQSSSSMHYLLWVSGCVAGDESIVVDVSPVCISPQQATATAGGCGTEIAAFRTLARHGTEASRDAVELKRVLYMSRDKGGLNTATRSRHIAMTGVTSAVTPRAAALLS